MKTETRSNDQVTEPKVSWADYYRQSPARIKVFLLGAALLSVFVTCGSLFLSWKILTISEEQTPRHIVRKTESKEEPIPEYTFGYEMRDISVPLKDALGRQIGHAQFVVMFDCPTKECRDQMPLHRARILDAINEAATHISISDVKGGTGMVTFKMHLKEILEMRLGKLAPRDLAIKNWYVG
jgi:hypothetical protein